MRLSFSFLVVFHCWWVQAVQTQQISPGIDLVNTFIGTGGDGYGIGSNPPGAQRPFGFARVGPDTVSYNDLPIPGAWRHNGGYYYPDYTMKCFSHTHMVGAGTEDYGTIGVMVSSKVPTKDDVFNYGFKSLFNHTTERSYPGYYSVFLDTPQVDVELTSTLFAGVHRYTWLDNAVPKVVLFPISHSIVATYPAGCKGAHVEVNTLTEEVSGWILNFGSMSQRFGGYTTYFVAKFNTTGQSKSIARFGVWNGSHVIDGLSTVDDPGNIANPNGVGAYVVIDSSTPSIEMYVGISSISVDQARLNLQVEVAAKNFDTLLNESVADWNTLFSRVELVGGTKEDQVKFWTAFYHSLNAPSIFSEEGGSYLGFDKQVHQLPPDMNHYYTDMSIWDVYRTEFPWLTFFVPSIMSDIVKSLLLMYEQGGDLPRWPFANGYTSSMTGVHAVICIVDAYLKGVPFNTSAAYNAIKHALTSQQSHASFPLDVWLKYGFIPYDIDPKGACWTLELSYDYWAASNMAKQLGHQDDYSLFFNASKNWKNVFNPEYKFFCPKTISGTWECPFTWLNVFDSRYVEGDAWHYRFYVPGDVEDLVATFGIEDFVSQLDTFLYYSEYDPSDYLPNPYYWAGNEPDIFSAYEFNYAGRPDLTQKYVRWLMNNQYTTDPNGLPGNDDYGTMSAWWLWGALGVYPLSGSTRFLLGSPLFDSITIHRAEGDFTVKAYNNSDVNFYVHRAAVNGVPLDMTSPFLDWELLEKACLLELWMSNSPPDRIG